MSNSNEILVSGSGKGNPSISTAWNYGKILAIINFLIWLAIAFGVRDSKLIRSGTEYRGAWGIPTPTFSTVYEFSTISYVMIAVGIVGAIYMLYAGYIISRNIETSMVNVYEDKIEGMAVDKDFTIAKLFFKGGNEKTKRFNLALNQITSVDLEYDHAVMINASGANYKCFVSNGSEIQDIINNKIRNG